jgi:hypothetical protein
MAQDTSILSKWRTSVCNTVIPLQLFRLHLQFDKHAEKTRYGTASMDSGLAHQLAPTSASAARVTTPQKHETEFPDAHVFHFLDFIDRVKQNDPHHNGMTMIDFVQSMPFSQLLEKLKRQCDERSRRSLTNDSKTPNMQDLAILKGAKAAVALSIRRRFPVNTADAFMASKSRGHQQQQQPTTKKPPPGKPYDRPSAAHGAYTASSSALSHDTTHLKLDATRDEIRREQEYLDRLIKAWSKYVRERLNLVPTHYRFAGNLYLCSKADDMQRQLDSYTWFQLPDKVPDYLRSCAHYPELGVTPETIEYPLYLSSRVRMWMQQKRHAELQNEVYLQQCVPMDMIRSQFRCIEEQVQRAFQLHLIHELMRSGQQLQQCYDGILADQPSMHDIVDICSPLHLDVDAYVTLFFDLIDRAYHENVQVLMSEDEMASAPPAERAKFARKKQRITDFATHMAKIKLYTRDWTQSQLEYQRKQQRREQDELMASTSATHPRAPDDDESKYDNAESTNDANAAMSDEARESTSTAAPEISSTRDIRMQPFYVPVQAALYPDQFLTQFQEQQKQKQIPAIDVLHAFLDLKGCPAEEWIAIMDNATQQEAKAIPQLVSIFCKLYIKTQSVKWTMQLRMVLSQAAFAMRCLGPTHVLYSTVVAWHAQIFAMLQRIHPLGRDGETTSQDAILELKHQFRTVAVESATSRFAIERIRWLLALSTYAARLAELTNKSERNEFIMNATEEFGFLDHRWRHEAAAIFDACFRHDKFKHAMDIVGTTRRHPTAATGVATSSTRTDDDFAPLVKIGTWLHGEKACILGVSPPVSAASLPILTFLPTHTDETSFALRDTSLHADFDNAVASLRDTWLSRDIYFHGKLEPSGAANTNESEDEQRIRLHTIWLQWLKINSFEWQNDDLLRTHLSTLLARYTIAIKTCSEMNMTWPTSIIQLYSRQLSWLQRMQSGTPTTHWEEWMHHLLCFHVVMTWLDAAECGSAPSPTAAASLSLTP